MACCVSGISLSSSVATSDVHSAGLGTACARKTRCTVPGWPLYIGAIDFKLYSYNLYSLLQHYFPSLPLGFVQHKLFYLEGFGARTLLLLLLLLLSLLLACVTHGQRVNETD